SYQWNVSVTVFFFQFISSNNYYLKYSYVYGTEWSQIAGLEEGLSSRCQKNCLQRRVTVALPIEATFKATNPFGWPQIVLSCYGTDSFGNDIVEGYGAVHIPTTPGKTVQTVPMFVPEASTNIQKFIGWMTGKRAEFIDPRTVASMTRVRSQGVVRINMQIILKDMRKLGYNFSERTTQPVLELPLRVSDESRTNQPPLRIPDEHKKSQIPKKEIAPQLNAAVKDASATNQQRRNLPIPPVTVKTENPTNTTTS
uniref:B9 domain-containing protein 1 n=1 Tax=Syphacia muris TaxID=451379 RepID=A0A0N5AHD4_9BILA